MFVAGKVVCAGIIFLLMTPWISGPPPTPVDSGTDRSSEVPAETDRNDVKEMQQTLQDKGQYHGKIDGVLALRTRASIRGFQRAENLPATGQLDLQTAGKLGVRPERQAAMSDQSVQDKPSAGITWADGSRRSGRTLRKLAKKRARTVPPTLASIRPLEAR
jgi:peptidoglycan hydrolase-like protein with peptidoglycan-binding domain